MGAGSPRPTSSHNLAVGVLAVMTGTPVPDEHLHPIWDSAPQRDAEGVPVEQVLERYGIAFREGWGDPGSGRVG